MAQVNEEKPSPIITALVIVGFSAAAALYGGGLVKLVKKGMRR